VVNSPHAGFEVSAGSLPRCVGVLPLVSCEREREIFTSFQPPRRCGAPPLYVSLGLGGQLCLQTTPSTQLWVSRDSY
jgi:hypothetical protein